MGIQAVKKLNRRRITSAGKWLGTIALSISSGCTLPGYRRAADQEAYSIVAQKSNDPRWDQPGFNIEIDPRSRYYDPYNPDCQPMPQDDPYSHRYMHCVNGMRGWPHWHDNGNRGELENPAWRQRLGEYVPINQNGEIELDLDNAVELAYVHSPTYQRQLETVYLSALDVSAERFRLSTQFFGGNTTTFRHLGRLRPGGEANTLTTSSDLQLTRRFATAGELAVGVANSIVWQFAGPDSNSNISILNMSLVQPLLRGAGRDRALETLTRAERGMLGNLRVLERYRHGFYTNISIGSTGVSTVSRLGGFQGGTGLTGFTGQGQSGLGGVGAATGFGGGFGGADGGGGVGGATGLAGGGAGQVGGFIGLLQSLQEIRNTQYSLDLQLRTLSLLEANLEAGTIDLTQVDQFRQSIETLRAQLLQARAGFQQSLDVYKTGTLGLPPDLPIDLQDDFITQFQLIDSKATELQEQIVQFQTQLGQVPAMPTSAELSGPVAVAQQLLQNYSSIYESTGQDLTRLTENIDKRVTNMDDRAKAEFQRDMQQVADDYDKRPGIFQGLQSELAQMVSQIEQGQSEPALRGLVVWARKLGDEVQSLVLVQARARLEGITLDPVKLDAPTALDIARNFRLDYMNNRAALVDTWRLIAFNADQLQSVLNLRLDGDLRTVGDNPVDFRGPTATATASLEFDAPFTRLLERNNYRQALIDYQQGRRSLIQFDDQLNLTLRNSLRTLEQLETNLEIQRRAVVIAIRRVDFTRSELNRPLPPAAPGAAATTFGPTAVQNLLSALSDLSNAQNNFMSVWLNYYGARMELMRDLGIMQIDDQGRWIDRPIDEVLAEFAYDRECLPPSVPEMWWEMTEPQTPSPHSPPPEAPLPEQLPTAARTDSPLDRRAIKRS